MKGISTLLFFVMGCIATTAQPQQPYKAKLTTLKRYLANYDLLSPIDDTRTISAFDLTETDKADLLKLGEEIDGGSDILTGETPEYEFIFFFQPKIVNALLQVLGDRSFNMKDMNQFGEYMTVAISPDERLASFSFFEKTGGSYRSYITVMYYLTSTQKPIFFCMDSEMPGYQPNDQLHEDGYYEIDTLMTKDQVYYVLLGHVSSCGSCFDQYIELIHIEEEQMVSSFGCYLQGPAVEMFDYNGNTRTFNLRYRIDRFHSSCFCELGMIIRDEGYACECTYVFDGKTFVLK